MNGTSIDQRAPVLALHCSLGSSGQWRPLAKLMPGREVIALDLLGYGNAPFPARGDDFTLDDEVDAIEGELDQRLGARTPLHVVGHSYGGAVAWRLTLRDPSRVKSIALFEPVTLWLIKHRPEAELLRTLARSAAWEVENGLTMQAAQRFIDFWSGPGAFSSLPVERRSALAERMSKVRLDFIACLAERATPPMPGGLKMPALLLNGRTTLAAMKANMRILQYAFSDCGTAEVPGGHMAPVENRAEVDPIIANFIERCEAHTAHGEDCQPWPISIPNSVAARTPPP